MVHRQSIEGFTDVIASHITAQYIAISLENKTVSVYTTEGEYPHVLRSRDNQTRCLLVWGSSLICGNVGGNMEMWDLATGDFQHTLTGHSDSVRSVTSVSTSIFATGTRDDSEILGRLDHVVYPDVYRYHVDILIRLPVFPSNPESKLLLSTGKDSCRVWHLTGESVAVLSKGDANASTSVFVSYPGGTSMVATGNSDGKLVIWNATTGAKLQTLDGPTAMIRSIIEPQGCESLLVSADISGTIIAWTYDSVWKLKWKILDAHAFSVSAICVKDKLLLTGGADGKIRIWRLETGELLRDFEKSYDAVYDVAFQDVVGKEIVVVAVGMGGRCLM